MKEMQFQVALGQEFCEAARLIKADPLRKRRCGTETSGTGILRAENCGLPTMAWSNFAVRSNDGVWCLAGVLNGRSGRCCPRRA